MIDLYWKNFIKFINKFGIYILIFLLSLSIRYFTIEHKFYFFIDEPYSYISSSPNNNTPEGLIAKHQWNSYNFEKSKIYTGKEIKKSMFELNSSIIAILKDLKTIRTNNIDRQHTNFYYSIFRIFNAGITNIDIKTMIQRGCFLNLIFFTLSFFFMYKLLSLIKNDKQFISLGLLFAFMSTSSISLCFFIREYALQETFFIIVNYVFLILCNKIINNEEVKIKQLFLYSLSISLFCLTSYFSIIYSFILFSAIFIITLYLKHYKHIKNFFIIITISILIILVIYPNYFDFWTNNEHIYGITQKIINFSGAKINENLCNIYILIKDFLIFPLLLLLIIYFLILEFIFEKNKLLFSLKNVYLKKELTYIALIILLAFIWTNIIFLIAPHPNYRYISASMISFSLIITTILNIFRKKILLFIIILPFIFLVINATYFQHFLMSGPKIRYIDPFYDIEASKKLFNKNIPVVFNDIFWFHAHYFPILRDNQKVIFENNIITKDYLPETFILIQNEDKLPIGKLLESNLGDNAYLVEK